MSQSLCRGKIISLQRCAEAELISDLTARANISDLTHKAISTRAFDLVTAIRADDDPGLMEVFLEEYGLSTDEGIALMCLAEALLRVPDTQTMDELIEDKIAPSSWGEHLGQSSSSLVNASTWALMLTGRVLNDDRHDGFAGVLHGAIKRMGEPVIRTAVSRAMKELGAQFVLGQDIKDAMKRGAQQEKKGFTYSYDMLGEAAMTAPDADRYFSKYKDAIAAISMAAYSDNPRENPGISIKLSALHPRYDIMQKQRVMAELVPRVLELALMARDAQIGLNIDAEESDRLDISLDIIEAVISDERLSGWEGFGVVVQAYGKRCSAVIDWLYDLAKTHERRLMVRLVKGAYWDTEIKKSQVEGEIDYPVFTRKAATDVSYIACAKQLLGMTDRLYPQFATHNAYTVAAVLELAGEDKTRFEFQRLHGMGEALHRLTLQRETTACRIYAPVGKHRDLLAYLVRRLLENGANSSFVNQIVDEDIPVEAIVENPFDKILQARAEFIKPKDIFGETRLNAEGWNIRHQADKTAIETGRDAFKSTSWKAGKAARGGVTVPIINPSNPHDVVGTAYELPLKAVTRLIDKTKMWEKPTAEKRAAILRKAADLFEAHSTEFFALLSREAGKSLPDAISELREAVDFLRYYANEAERHGARAPRGVFACISPWNFPLAIFAGQIAAGLAAGNGVVAKPAETTPLIAARAIALLHKAGVPKTVLKLAIGQGAVVGAALTAHPKIKGVCFTGSTATAQIIHRNMADHLSPDAALIAETGGLNAMIVDSTALPEQAVRDIVASAFQSAGQRCSALRLLYIQEDVAETVLEMLYGAMDELSLGDPWDMVVDIGPVIDSAAQTDILNYIKTAQDEGRLTKQLKVPEIGYFVPPSVIKVSGIADLPREIFGPVLHIATFKAKALPRLVDDLNGRGFGLTFGVHSRIDDRVELLVQKICAGNSYVNRNQIGAVVGSQPFGGEGLSGTGPKAGGPHYLNRFYAVTKETIKTQSQDGLSALDLQKRIDLTPRDLHRRLSQLQMDGPTGESNMLSFYGRGRVLCLGPGMKQVEKQADIASALGCSPVSVPDVISPETLTQMQGVDVVAYDGDLENLRHYRRALAARDGAIIPIVNLAELASYCIIERHVCIDTTAAGGNTSLLAGEA